MTIAGGQHYNINQHIEIVPQFSWCIVTLKHTLNPHPLPMIIDFRTPVLYHLYYTNWKLCSKCILELDHKNAMVINTLKPLVNMK